MAVRLARSLVAHAGAELLGEVETGIRGVGGEVGGAGGTTAGRAQRRGISATDKKRALATRAAETYVLASDEKIGAASRFSVLPLDAVADLVVDRSPRSDDPKEPTLRELEEQGVLLLS